MRRSTPINSVALTVLGFMGLVGLVGCRGGTPRDSIVVGGEPSHGAVSTCAECHLGSYTSSRFDHASVDYGHDCGDCHLDNQWTPSFNDPQHDRFFPLVGAHTARPCADCHQEGRADPQPTACVGCHRADTVGVDPDHASFPDACGECHTSARWSPASFDHERVFPLRGAHAGADCGSCHVDNVYEGTPRDCVGCHADDRDRAVDPDHRLYPDNCTVCHSEVSWRPADFDDHDSVWPLEGQHAQADCASCHQDNRYTGTPRDCIGCHAEDRARAQPDHTGFAVTCNDCHSVQAWRPAIFDHDAVWPLTGQHTRAECTDCHINEVYDGTPRDCVGCHAEDRRRAVDPDHSAFPADCAECHSTRAWEPAAFNHDVFFRIEGAHTRAECNDCHINEVYAGTPRTCVGCHQGDRDQARPTHARFSNTCTECHTQNAFSPATHQHRQFRVPHEGVRQCGSCHTDPNDYANVGCTSCHEHSRGNTDGEHRGIRNYRYEDSACLDCHPAGRE